MVAYAVDYTDDIKELDKNLAIYRNLIRCARNIRATNCLIDFLNVAEGKFGACLNLNTRIWDISALGLIISEAGGVIKNIDSGDVKYVFNENTAIQNFPVMAGPESIIEEIRRNVLK